MGKINITETERMTDLVTPLSLVIDEAVDKGYDLIFRIKEDGSLWDQNGIHYDLEEMKIAYSRIFKEDPDDARNTRSTKYIYCVTMTAIKEFWLTLMGFTGMRESQHLSATWNG